MAAINSTHVKVINGISRGVFGTYEPVAQLGGVIDDEGADEDGMEIGMEANEGVGMDEGKMKPHKSTDAVSV